MKGKSLIAVAWIILLFVIVTTYENPVPSLLFSIAMMLVNIWVTLQVWKEK